MFFTFYQNNSFGAFHKDDDIKEYVIIEADSHTEANDRAEEIGIYFNGCRDGRDCECCGDRWYPQWDDDGEAVPCIHGEPISEDTKKDSTFQKEWIVHFKNGGKSTELTKVFEDKPALFLETP